MLLHSREGSGEHRPVDANALVEESLNLAYHGARAEKQGFKINVERFFDPAAGQVDVFLQEITRALLNLISNGFYAATKRKEQDNSDSCEPTLTASTKNLGDRVEIRIHDNGTGVSPEVREKMFNPFFTTKPAGEGTGLGLSITHDIIVKQHSASIEVDTKPGEFTEVRIILVRTATLITDTGGRRNLYCDAVFLAWCAEMNRPERRPQHSRSNADRLYRPNQIELVINLRPRRLVTVLDKYLR